MTDYTSNNKDKELKPEYKLVFRRIKVLGLEHIIADLNGIEVARALSESGCRNKVWQLIRKYQDKNS